MTPFRQSSFWRLVCPLSNSITYFCRVYAHLAFVHELSEIVSMKYIALALLFLAACAAPEEAEHIHKSASNIYWSDGDSGRIDGIKFRLANVDAPETGGVGARGGAKCEAERVRGYRAKECMVELTAAEPLEITTSYGEDRYGRLVIDLSVEGLDVAQTAVDDGQLAPWPHKGRRALSKKPDWCTG